MSAPPEDAVPVTLWSMMCPFGLDDVPVRYPNDLLVKTTLFVDASCETFHEITYHNNGTIPSKFYYQPPIAPHAPQIVGSSVIVIWGTVAAFKHKDYISLQHSILYQLPTNITTDETYYSCEQLEIINTLLTQHFAAAQQHFFDHSADLSPPHPSFEKEPFFDAKACYNCKQYFISACDRNATACFQCGGVLGKSASNSKYCQNPRCTVCCPGCGVHGHCSGAGLSDISLWCDGYCQKCALVRRKIKPLIISTPEQHCVRCGRAITTSSSSSGIIIKGKIKGLCRSCCACTSHCPYCPGVNGVLGRNEDHQKTLQCVAKHYSITLQQQKQYHQQNTSPPIHITLGIVLPSTSSNGFQQQQRQHITLAHLRNDFFDQPRSNDNNNNHNASLATTLDIVDFYEDSVIYIDPQNLPRIPLRVGGIYLLYSLTPGVYLSHHQLVSPYAIQSAPVIPHRAQQVVGDGQINENQRVITKLLQVVGMKEALCDAFQLFYSHHSHHPHDQITTQKENTNIMINPQDFAQIFAKVNKTVTMGVMKRTMFDQYGLDQITYPQQMIKHYIDILMQYNQQDYISPTRGDDHEQISPPSQTPSSSTPRENAQPHTILAPHIANAILTTLDQFELRFEHILEHQDGINNQQQQQHQDPQYNDYTTLLFSYQQYCTKVLSFLNSLIMSIPHEYNPKDIHKRVTSAQDSPFNNSFQNDFCQYNFNKVNCTQNNDDNDAHIPITECYIPETIDLGMDIVQAHIADTQTRYHDYLFGAIDSSTERGAKTTTMSQSIQSFAHILNTQSNHTILPHMLPFLTQSSMATTMCSERGDLLNQPNQHHDTSSTNPPNQHPHINNTTTLTEDFFFPNSPPTTTPTTLSTTVSTTSSTTRSERLQQEQILILQQRLNTCEIMCDTLLLMKQNDDTITNNNDIIPVRNKDDTNEVIRLLKHQLATKDQQLQMQAQQLQTCTQLIQTLQTQQLSLQSQNSPKAPDFNIDSLQSDHHEMKEDR